jgi:hypothetical protein
MSSELEILIQLKTQLVNFFDELIETFPNEPDFVIFRIFIKDRIPIVDAMAYIANKLVPLQDMVKRQDANFFLQNNILFEKLDKNKVNHFKQMWLSENLDDDDKKVIWKWFASFIYLANKYLDILKKQREE